MKASRLAHINLRSEDRLAIARDERERRALVRAVAEAAAGRLLAFNVVDEHLHLLARSDWPARLADAVRRVLGARRPDLALTRPHVKPIRDRDHLENCVGYILRQTDHHEVGGAHPALWSGSAFQDLVGARLLPGFDATILRQELPRLKARELYREAGLAPVELVPSDDAALHRAGPARLAELCAAVFAADPAYAGKFPETVRARTLAAHMGRRLELETETVARYLGIGARGVRHLVERNVIDTRAERALRVAHALHERVHGRPRVPGDRTLVWRA